LHLLGAPSTHGKEEVQHGKLNFFNSSVDTGTICEFCIIREGKNKKASPVGEAF
jgi:hypothetical protein